jgi:hypothetical protein
MVVDGVADSDSSFGIVSGTDRDMLENGIAE